jgi:hypothetical protein
MFPDVRAFKNLILKGMAGGYDNAKVTVKSKP